MNIEELTIWFFFFALNAIIYLPKYLVEIKTSSIIPFKGFFKGSVFERIGYLFLRYNYDIFRISIDLLLIFIGIYCFRGYLSIGIVTIMLTIFFTIIFSYQIYYIAFEKLYNIEPVFYNDINMLKAGLTLISAESLSKLILILIGLLGLIFSFYLLIKKTIHSLFLFQYSSVTIGLVAFLLFCSVISIQRYKLFVKPRQGFQSQVLSIINNIFLSLEASKNLKKFEISKLLERTNFNEIKLKKKPNIFLIAVESYGRVVIDKNELKESYTRYMTEHQKTLSRNGFHSTSNLSKAPVSGGGSWVSYSSILYGFNIENQGTYHALFNNSDLDEYENMMRFCRKRGYKNYYLNSLAGYEKIKIPWKDLSRFYGVDEWITYKDLKYKSHLFGFGPAPPDQYTLNYAFEQIKNTGVNPFTLFFLTQNSHNPFYTLPDLAEDWRTLNEEKIDGHQTSRFLVQPNIENYQKAIKYQIDFLMDFINKNGSDNDLFILVGDHQPIVIADENDGKETPIHIISKDADLLNQFNKYGFSKGLLTDPSSPIKHEGIYSMLLRGLTAEYGAKDSIIPEYYPDGTAW